MTTLEHRAVQETAAALRAAGLDAAAAGIRILADDVRTAAAAAAALGIPVGAIANSLVFAARHGTEDHPLLVLTSGDHRADTALVAGLVGADEVRRAKPEFVREHTGQAIGGVAPVGHPRPLETLVDSHLARYPVVWAAAGHPKSVFPTTYADLVALTGGTAARVGVEEDDPST
ncbi:YbaK/EbsC family protein [Actinokineospora auranticolor]|uniref:Prolyl-tRNA editing enzyme YbaK/EbsC (Cys-tRNA(Pro) deacylase) n=1 Tax=Actinokineospora auranticolor TaxID=155976 RepID=A0A2S6GG40_9PSEU|nr:YbaK/EbsC family protein [Actinokineospora auranticolor]PPK64155.1 prolyl-tRNA editing enzyme YbaK/EbsC (Cys-tRNA(Pro) deacylase) [Actinokineospora auranticolor]